MKDVAPSHELRKWFGHAPARWQEFQARYRVELQDPEAASALAALRRLAGKEKLTLLYAASEQRMNNAVALRSILRSPRGKAKK
jgi:uncharacterized protein YeaO (DUF488 family)